jgi:hypothetical protein
MNGTQLKIEGLELAASKHQADLTRAQDIAELYGMVANVVTSDDVREFFLERYGRELKIGNAMGSLFSRKKWICVGRIKSKRDSSHARWISQWKLKRVEPAPPQPFDVGVENGVRFCLECSQETEKCTCNQG